MSPEPVPETARSGAAEAAVRGADSGRRGDVRDVAPALLVLDRVGAADPASGPATGLDAVGTGDLRRLFASARVARVATVRPDGGPHAVPCVSALVGDTVHSAVDAEPERSRGLQRLASVRADPCCALLVDHHDDELGGGCGGSEPNGRAQVVDDADTQHPGIRSLVERFAQYREEPPPDRSSS